MSEAQTAATQATPEVAAQATTQAQAAAPAVSTTASATATATEAKPATSEAQPAAKVAPEKYDLKLPDGSTLDQSAIERVATYAKEKGLSQEMAQAVLEREHMAVDSYSKSIDEQWKAQQAQWTQTVQSDKEMGGAAFKENVELAHRVIKKYASEEFVNALESSGFGNHPELMRVFLRIGKQMSEDKLVLPGAQAGGKKSIEEIFYGKQT